MTEPWLQRDGVTLYAGDCLDVLRELPDASVDAVVTDPPYGLEFMGKDWDSFAPRDRKNATVWDGRRQAQDGWQEDAAARSGKGGGGPSYRSQHKGAKRCELCGRRAFSGTPCTCPEPVWVVEHRQEAPAAMLGFQAWCTEWSRECYRVLKPGGHLLAFGGTRTWHRLACAVEDAGFEIRDSIAWLYGSGFPKSLDVSRAIDAHQKHGGHIDTMNTPHSPAPEQALNIDASRIEQASDADLATSLAKNPGRTDSVTSDVYGADRPQQRVNTAGRWPANVALDETQADALDQMSGDTRAAKPSASGSGGAKLGYHGGATKDVNIAPFLDSGGASRFFYVARWDEHEQRWHLPIDALEQRFYYTAKADASERPRVNGAAHPTVKPLTLMRWLVRLVTPPGGTVLEPFAGSGTTVEACILEGFACIAIERDLEQLPNIELRITRQRDPIRAMELTGDDPGLFALIDEEPA